METEMDDQSAPTDEDGTRASRGRVHLAVDSPPRGGKKPKGAAMDDASMDDNMNEEGEAVSEPDHHSPLLSGEKLTEVSVGPRSRVVSYKDKLLRLNEQGGHSDNDEEDRVSKQKREDEEAKLMEGLAQDVPDDPLCPRYTFSVEEHKRDCEQWRKALIIKLIGKRMRARVLMMRLQRLWSLMGAYELIDLDNGHLLLRFQEDNDYRHVLEEGPWIVNDHYVVVQRWRSFFDPYDESFKRLAVWIRIPGLPIELYTTRHLWRIGNIFGRTLKVDRNSLRKSDLGDVITERGRFARICVEVDLRKSFLSKFVIGNTVYQVGYEGLHLICFECGLYGHRQNQCPAAQDRCKGHEEVSKGQVNVMSPAPHKEKMEVKQDEAFESWMVVQRKPRNRKQKAKSSSPTKEGDGE
ncbi:uncharacterized protein LOC133287599 [Gastrolobium bilobum]|uniref:uncharacterized protein LOC133287599 n=1 Tax=Gastrolobium bilobum TaxID=150636 RepID=UPI002AB1DAFA|nr:uncharacterized protein LOC133287599 [Gastrolobium bilobum]